MFIIKNDIENQIEIKKSKFICLIYHIDNLELVDRTLKEAKEKYKNATHYCYAYNINGIMKCSDDKEPSGTAGIPMLDVIKLKDLTNVLVIVIRYFGGVKLGASPLLRAYRTSVIEALNKTDIIPYKKYINKTITLPLNMNNKLQKLERKYEVIDKKYQENIEITFKIKEEDIENFNNDIK